MAKKTKDVKPWDGSSMQEVRLRIPTNVVILCKLAEVDPEELLQCFLTCLALENTKKSPESAKHTSVDFFIRHGFDAAYYSEDELRQMFTELRRVNEIWLDEVITSNFLDYHANWRRKYYKRWFKKWYWKIRRKKKTAHSMPNV